MTQPDWFDNAKIKMTLDARPLLAHGIHPLERVQEECATLAAGEIYRIITPFPPTPMIEKMAAAGFGTYTEQKADGMYHTFFRR